MPTAFTMHSVTMPTISLALQHLLSIAAEKSVISPSVQIKMSGRQLMKYCGRSTLASPEPHTRDVGVVLCKKPPGHVLVLARVIDSDARTGPNCARSQFSILDPKHIT